MPDNVNKGITTYIVDGKEVDEATYREAQKKGARSQKSEVKNQKSGKNKTSNIEHSTSNNDGEIKPQTTDKKP